METGLRLDRSAFIPRPFPHWGELVLLFKECTPRILVVTDGLSYGTATFGLKDFVDTLKGTTIHGMTPIVETAHTGGIEADHKNFTFTADSFSNRKYDVLFLFGVSSGPALSSDQLSVISTFMDNGGGVFATGDHAELGRAMCAEIPRVRSMRYWKSPDVPSAGGADRLTTNLPGADDSYQFDDQSDALPQRLYPTYYAAEDGIPANSRPHYLLQHPTKKIIEVFPDHPHEGECVVPGSLAGGDWPDATLGGSVAPELIALSMSAGGGFPGKQPVVPRSFGAICAYDGHLAGVGRVTTDATWHHFINVNLVHTTGGPGLAGDPDALERVHTYFRNTAEWLMPSKRRRCLRWPILITALELLPVKEIHRSLPGCPFKDVKAAIELGDAVASSLQPCLHPAALAQFEDDLLGMFSEELVHALRAPSGDPLLQQLGRRAVARPLFARVALGVAAATVGDAMPFDKDLADAFRAVKGVGGIEEQVKTNLSKSLHDASLLLRDSRQHVDAVCEIL